MKCYDKRSQKAGRAEGQKSCRGVAGDEAEAEVEAKKEGTSRTHSRIRQAEEEEENRRRGCQTEAYMNIDLT